MSHPVLRVDSAKEILLEAPRLASALLTVACLVLASLARQWLPGLLFAPWIFAAAALWAASNLLRCHQLRLDLPERSWTFRRGWLWQPPQHRGTFDDLAGVVIEENELAVGKLRSRLLLLQFKSWQPPEEGFFALGFAMGPTIAPERAQHYAERLGVPVIDRVAESTDDVESRPSTDS